MSGNKITVDGYLGHCEMNVSKTKHDDILRIMSLPESDYMSNHERITKAYYNGRRDAIKNVFEYLKEYMTENTYGELVGRWTEESLEDIMWDILERERK